MGVCSKFLAVEASSGDGSVTVSLLWGVSGTARSTGMCFGNCPGSSATVLGAGSGGGVVGVSDGFGSAVGASGVGSKSKDGTAIGSEIGGV